MKIDDALRSVKRIAFDTAPLIYYLENHPDYAAIVDDVIQRIDLGDLEAVTSTLTLTEVLTQPLKSGDTVLEQEYRQLLVSSGTLPLIPIDAYVASIAADFRAKYGLKTPDALQIATAIFAGCDAILTNDTKLQKITEIRILIVKDLQI